VSRDFASAISNYDKSLKLNVYDADYALFQKSFCQGLLKDHQSKINGLQALILSYPKSSYQDDALFELGRTYERINQPQTSIGFYKDLTNRFPQSSFVNKAMVQLGLVYYNTSDYQNSIDYYKKVVERAPNSPEMQAALSGMKNSYIEKNDVEGYFNYTRKLGPGVQVSVSEQDSLTYQAAEKLYLTNDDKAQSQLERYLTQFPSGSFATNAHFYLAQILYKNGNFDRALTEYESVISKPDNYFTEVSLSKAAGLQYNKKNFGQALQYFERYARISNSGNNLLDARTGIMRSHFQLANYKASIDAANLVLGSEKVSDVLKRESNYILSLSYYNTGDKERAFPILSNLSAETNSAEGAESKYLLAEILFERQKLKEAEKEILDFIDKNSPHQFWLAKSFILLSDIYVKNGDEFQAKHTLKSIIENYPETNDGILDTTRRKLQEIEEIEATQTINQSKPLEIDITGGKK
jgi:TolA-binding protein